MPPLLRFSHALALRPSRLVCTLRAFSAAASGPPYPPPPLPSALGVLLTRAPFRSFRLDLTALPDADADTGPAARAPSPSPSPSPSPLPAASPAAAAAELAALAAALAREPSHNTLWLELRLAQGGLLAAAAAAGFEFHHARGARATLMRWLPGAARPSKVPPFATHQVGVAGCVIDADHRLLLVREAGRGAAVGWKLPGGLAERGESFGETAAREVFEETGVRAGSRGVLLMRHAHEAAAFGVSDLYVVCRMAPAEGAAGRSITVDPEEIDDACWMAADAFAAQTRHPLARHVALLASHELRREQAARPAAAGPAGEEPSWAIAETDVFFSITGRVSKVYSAAAAPRPQAATEAELAAAAAEGAAAAARAEARRLR